MTFPICPVCNHPVRRRNRTVHKSCADERVVLAAAPDITITVPKHTSVTYVKAHECCFCLSTDTSEKDGGWFCEKHYPYDERTTVRQRTLTATPERCERCGEVLSPAVTKGKIKCECDQPKMPIHLRGNDNDDTPPSAVRYGN